MTGLVPPPSVVGWFTTGSAPALIGARCTTCGTTAFPPVLSSCPAPTCPGVELEPSELSRRGQVWSYTDAQYQPPPPYVARTDPYVPFALAAVELPEGMVVLGQLADGYGVDDVRVGSEVELVVEPLDGAHVVWRWKPVAELGQESDG